MSSADAWSHYWASGQTVSLHGAGQADVLEAHWRTFFAQLPEGASVLDLACGAGAVSKLALAANRGFEVTGVDYAAGLQEVEGVTLQGGISIEALPQADASFGAVVSQYGFEYADTGLAARELARVLAPGGQAALLIHASDGQPVADARRRLALVNPLIQTGGIVAVTQELVAQYAKGKDTANLQAQAASAWQMAAQAKQDETTHWAISFSGDLWRRRAEFTPKFMTESMAACRAEIETYIARLDAMIGAALGEAEIAKLRDVLRQAGLEMHAPEAIQSGDKQIGWWLAGQKATD